MEVGWRGCVADGGWKEVASDMMWKSSRDY